MRAPDEEVVLRGFYFGGITYNRRFSGVIGWFRKLLKRLRGERYDRALGIRVMINDKEVAVVDLSRIPQDGVWWLNPPIRVGKKMRIDCQIIPPNSDIAPGYIRFISEKI